MRLMIILVAILFSNLLSQVTVGKIYTKAEATAIYGNVIFSITIPASTITNLFDKEKDMLLFRIKDKKVVILGKKRNSLIPHKYEVEPNEEFRILSVSKLKELLLLGQTASVTLELRKHATSKQDDFEGATFTITAGETTLEESFPCPPCIDN